MFFQKHYQSVKQFGSRSWPTFCRSWSGSKLFAKVISKASRERVNIFNLIRQWLYISFQGHISANLRMLILDCHQHNSKIFFSNWSCVSNSHLLYPPQTLFVVGILFSRCSSARPSVTLCFLNILKSHGWIFIKPCKHVHICKTNTLNKKVRARGQFY